MNAVSSQAPTPAVQAALARAERQLADGNVLSAEIELRQLVERHPGLVEAWLILCELAARRGDDQQAQSCLAQAQAASPGAPEVALQQAYLQVDGGDLGAAAATLAGLLQRRPGDFVAWLLLGQVFEMAGQRELAVRAWFQALHYGRTAGQLTSMASTPPAFRPVIEQIIGVVGTQQYAAVEAGLARMREQFGADEMKRLDHALAVYAGKSRHDPPNPHQRPKFLYFPGLPEGPYHDPYLHPWTQRLVDGYDDIRREALAVLQADTGIEEFLTFAPGQRRDAYLGGSGPRPSWDAFFFYRHGQRYDENHLRCPATSRLLDSIELCHVAGQAPEICFSVLQPGTTIMPHHGVTNTRLVLHLPLVVPPGCALNVRGGGEHAWREREPMMFDDTFEHEAWNRSDQQRIILLMDCWNPHLSEAERIATRHVVELISKAENFPPHELAQAAAMLRA